MKKKQIRTFIIVAIIIAFVGISLWRLKIEPAHPAQTPDSGYSQQDGTDVETPQDGDTAAPEDGAADGEDPAADPETPETGDPAENTDTPAQEDPSAGETPAEAPTETPAEAPLPAQPYPAAPTQQPAYPEAPTQKPEEDPADEVTVHTCTLEIRCDTLLDTSKVENEAILPYIPSDGVILATTEVTYTPGESVFDILKRVTRDQDIQMEFREDALYSGAYIEGIHYLYEFDGGTLSGWMYKVNGQFPNYGCSKYYVSDGDEIVWMYTCDLGRDVGDNSVW